jgi:MtN3 and saliva related transmembrane protein
LSDLKTEIIGWAAAIVLLLTIGKQVHKQWRDKTSEGISKWLFAGQVTAVRV